MTLCSAAHHPSLYQNGAAAVPFINDGFSKHPFLTHRLLLVAPTKGYHIIAQDWVLWPATCWFCVLKSNLCFCQMFVCPTNCDHVGLLGCSSTIIIILILWILCVLWYADSTGDAPHPTKTVLVINYYNYLLQLFTLSILCLWWRPPRRNTICLCSSVCWWMMAQEKSRLHLNTLLEYIQSFSRAASSMQFLINGALVLQHKSPLNDAGDTQRKVFSAGQHQWRGNKQCCIIWVGFLEIQFRCGFCCSVESRPNRPTRGEEEEEIVDPDSVPVMQQNRNGRRLGTHVKILYKVSRSLVNPNSIRESFQVTSW